jgi:phage tail-like protein
MAPSSSYTQYLPPFLWSKESDPEQFLARFLCIFEAILTGRDDTAAPLQTLRNGQYQVYPPYEKIIDHLPDLFNPWRVPVRFLPFLASCLDLTLEPSWDEYQRRRMIEGATELFKQRWLKRGLYSFLDIYAAAQVRPRVTIDDGEAILRGLLLPDGSLPLQQVAFARPGQGPNHLGAALSHPTAILVAGTGAGRRYIVADAGPQDLAVPRGALWSVSLNGGHLWKPASGSPGTLIPAPLNDGEPAPALQTPIAIATESDGVYLVLDAAAGQPNAAAIYRYRVGTPTVRETVIAATALQAAYPVDMVRDPASGALLVLDQGDIPHGGATSSPRVMRVAVPATGPSPVTVFPLGTAASYPTALVLGTSPGTLLITDAGQQAIPPNQPTPYPPDLLAKLAGDVLGMSLTTGAAAVSVLKAATSGKTGLVNPVALTLLSDGSLLILDDGLKTTRAIQIDHTIIPHTGVLVSPARVLRVHPAVPGPPEELSLRAPLVKPSRIIVDGSTIVVLEQGSFLNALDGSKQDWRCQAHCFGVTVDFSRQDFGSWTIEEILEAQRLILKGLAGVLDTEKPAHSSWSFQFQFDPSQRMSSAVRAALEGR